MKKIILFLALLCAQYTYGQLVTGENIAVTSTNSGKVRGYIFNGIYTYKGIPYAEANRFEAPHAPASWDGVRSSMTYGPVAPLLDPTTRVQDESEFVFDHDWGYTSEDCMRLNIWTKAINDGKKRPVMFWIHGGGYTAGSSQELPSYDGENLARKGDVVVVFINHRLNVLGYLDLSVFGEKYKHSANISILDIKAALEWVQQNIANFGGDPGNVTIFGQSGGGAKVNTLMAMPSAKGLFHKAINQSGAFRGTMLEKETTQAITAEVLKELNITASSIDDIQKVPFTALSEASKKALKIVADQLKAAGKPVTGFGLSWGPSVDGVDLPYQMFAPEALELSKNVPLLIGTVKNEFMPSLGAGLSNAPLDKVIEFIQKQYGDKSDAFIKAVKKAYPHDIKPSDLIDVDTRFRPGAVYEANLKSNLTGGAPVYMYLFDWQSPVMDGKYKAIHCSELAFCFNNIQRTKNMCGGGAKAQVLADKVSQAWINFARKGNPAHAALPAWPAYNEKNTATMHFDNSCSLKPQLDKELFELVAQ
ncbi:MAG: carboxylesterase/lipase family protein [Saprospiraceae bacterium]|nr:carboxylesterase/lipase family protein [Saprospiraceae bacterium]